MTINDVKIEECCGCEACVDSCPSSAISMHKNVLGFLYPEIENEKCCKCGKCAVVCPVNNPTTGNTMKKVYAGYCTNRDDLLKSASGGFAYAISKYVIEKGGVVFGVKYGDNHMPQWDYAETIEQIEAFRGSKYAETNHNGMYHQIKQKLNDNRLVLVIGLPHDIVAIRKFLGSKTLYDNLILVDLICNSITSQRVLHEFIEGIEQTQNKKVEHFTLRYKKNGKVAPVYTQICFSDGSLYEEILEKTSFQKGFSFVKRSSCYNCKYKGNSSCADLSIGDFWGIESQKDIYNEAGTSLVLQRTEKGLRLVTYLLAERSIRMIEVNSENALSYNHMSFQSISKLDSACEFEAMLSCNKLNDTCRLFLNKQRVESDRIISEIKKHNYRLALWGAGNAADVLYKRFNMNSWNIKYVFDSSKYKVRTNFNGYIVRHIKDIANLKNEIDAIIVCISTVSFETLKKQLYDIGYHKLIYNIGQFRYDK